jgi:hypothetical protein
MAAVDDGIDSIEDRIQLGRSEVELVEDEARGVQRPRHVSLLTGRG